MASSDDQGILGNLVSGRCCVGILGESNCTVTPRHAGGFHDTELDAGSSCKLAVSLDVQSCSVNV